MASDAPAEFMINGRMYVLADDMDALADAFLARGGESQAEFLHAIARDSGKWRSHRSNQWFEINRHITPMARTMLREWAEYFEKPNEEAA